MIIGYTLALIIGISLGLLGGGGSILTVPILVYVLKMDPKTSIALSLAIVGATSLIGSVGHYRKGNVDLKVALIFGPIAMIGTFMGSKLSVFLSGAAQLIIFAFVMLLAAVFMFRDKKAPEKKSDGPQPLNIPLIAVEGILVGILTGIVGVGGGFMIVPALVLLGNVSMKKAVGTSLLVIAMKSFSGFIGYMGLVEIPWGFLTSFTLFTIFGIIAGTYLVQYVPAKHLKKGFAIFLVIMGIFILYKNRQSFTNITWNVDLNQRNLEYYSS